MIFALMLHECPAYRIEQEKVRPIMGGLFLLLFLEWGVQIKG